MTIYVDQSGTYQQVKQVWIDEAGTYKRATEVYVYTGGVWEQVLQLVRFTDGSGNDSSQFTAVDIDFLGSNPTNADVEFRTNGEIRNQNTQLLGYWIDGTAPITDIGDDFEIRASSNSGLTVGTFNSWLPLSSARLWGITVPAGQNQSGTAIIDIRKVGTTTILDSTNITCQGDGAGGE